MTLTSLLKERLAGCSDANCILRADRKGMRTNGGCHCRDFLPPLHALLIECVKALEFYASGANWTTHDEEMLFNNISDKDWYKPNDYFCGGKLATETLTKLRAEVSKSVDEAHNDAMKSEEWGVGE